jgi:phytoene synthase
MPDTSFIEGAAAYCRKLTTRSKSNFYYAFLFLPRDKREALEAVYAYCRLVDDVVDEDAPVAQKLAGIARWRDELEHVYGPNEPAHPVAARLQDAVQRFGIRRQDVEAVIDGCAMDIDKTRYADWDELRLYCYRVASAVGLMCIEIFGYTPSQQDAARRYAVDLGLALQLTNILRDVAEDARRGRVYLPADELAQFGVTVEDLVAGNRSARFVRLMQFEAARARAHYLRARAALSIDERRKLVIAEIMGDIYYRLLQRIEARNFDVFGAKTTVSRLDKMSIALGNFARAQLHRLTLSSS